MEKAAPNVGRESHWWAKIVEFLARYDVRSAANVAAQGITGQGLNQEDDSRKLLIAIAGGDPEIAMEALGRAIMDDSRGWRFFVVGTTLLKNSLHRRSSLGSKCRGCAADCQATTEPVFIRRRNTSCSAPYSLRSLDIWRR